MAARRRNRRTFLRTRKRLDRSRASRLHANRRRGFVATAGRTLSGPGEMYCWRLSSASFRGSQQGRSDRARRFAPSTHPACRPRSNSFRDTARAAERRPRRSRGTMADSISEIGALGLGKSSGTPSVEPDGCARHHDSIRTPHLRAMAGPARTHQEKSPRPLRARARILRLGQAEFRRYSAIRLSKRTAFELTTSILHFLLPPFLCL